MTDKDLAAESNGAEREYVLRLRTPQEPSQDLGEGSIRVTVEDVSLLDEPSTVVAEATAEPEPTVATLAVRAALDPRGHYLVRVHVARGGDGVVRPGDLVGVAQLEADTSSSQPTDVHLTQVLEQPED